MSPCSLWRVTYTWLWTSMLVYTMYCTGTHSSQLPSHPVCEEPPSHHRPLESHNAPKQRIQGRYCTGPGEQGASAMGGPSRSPNSMYVLFPRRVQPVHSNVCFTATYIRYSPACSNCCAPQYVKYEDRLTARVGPFVLDDKRDSHSVRRFILQGPVLPGTGGAYLQQ